ncbi:MAG: hypothetical protein ABIJ34_09600 [archaeon]
MKIKVKKQNPDGVVRLESGGEIKEVLVNEDFLNPKQESISICWRGKTSSGIIDMTPSELEKLYNTVQKRTHLVKGFKVFRDKEPII